MKKMNASLLIPMGSFVVALGLSLLFNGGMFKQVMARQAGGGTPCTGTLTANAITVAAVTWEHTISKQTVTATNNQKAYVDLVDVLRVSATNVTVTDTAGKKHTWATYPFNTNYAPIWTPSFPAPGGNKDLSPGTATLNAIQNSLKADINAELAKLVPPTAIKRLAYTLGAQGTITTQVGTFTCEDGTKLTFTPRPPTTVNVNAKGTGGPVVN